ncbi:MAG: hypothetical protein AB7S75_20170, partial [Desulfococcaceae bacterium]
LGDFHEKMYHHCRVGTAFCAHRFSRTAGTKSRARPAKNVIIINGNHLKELLIQAFSGMTGKSPYPQFRRKQESIFFKVLWTQAFS